MWVIMRGASQCYFADNVRRVCAHSVLSDRTNLMIDRRWSCSVGDKYAHAFDWCSAVTPEDA